MTPLTSLPLSRLTSLPPLLPLHCRKGWDGFRLSRMVTDEEDEPYMPPPLSLGCEGSATTINGWSPPPRHRPPSLPPPAALGRYERSPPLQASPTILTEPPHSIAKIAISSQVPPTPAQTPILFRHHHNRGRRFSCRYRHHERIQPSISLRKMTSIQKEDRTTPSPIGQEKESRTSVIHPVDTIPLASEDE